MRSQHTYFSFYFFAFHTFLIRGSQTTENFLQSEGLGRELTFIECPPTSEHFIFIISCNQDCEIVILLTQIQPSDADITPFPGFHFPVFPIPAVPLWFLRESPFPHFCLFSDLFQIPNGCQSADVDSWDVLSLVSSSPSTPLLSSLVTPSLLGWLAG